MFDHNVVRYLANNPESPMDKLPMTVYREYEEHVKQRIQYYKFMYSLLKARKPCVALELGVEYGICSSFMASAMNEVRGKGKVIGVDRNFHHVPGTLISDTYSDIYHYIVSDTVRAWSEIRDLCKLYGPIGIVFQDSSHHYAHSVKEWDTYSRLLDYDAIWVCDDITPSFYEEGVDEKSMVSYFDERPGHHMLFPNILHKGNTIGVILL